MKLGKRLSLLAVTALMVGLVPVFGVHAQDASGCTLSASDCALLDAATANIPKVTSFVQNFDFSLNLTNAGQTVNVKVSGSGPFGVATSASMSDQTAALSAITLQLDLSGSVSAPGQADQAGKASVIITGGVAYFSTDGKTWQGVQLSQLVAIGQAAMKNGSTAATTTQAQSVVTQLMTDPAVLQSIAAIPTIKGFITQARAADTTLGDLKIAQFTDTIDPQALFTSPDILPLIKAVLKIAASQNPGGAGAMANMNDQQLQGMLAMVGPVLGKTNLVVTTLVGIDDKLFHGFGLDLNLDINAASLTGGSGSSGGTSQAVTGLIHFLVKLSNVGQPVKVTAPAGATMIDLAKMIGNIYGNISSGLAATPAQ